jgi:gamma-glutamyltranspeptidase/glutathione hydrolase
MGQHGMAASSVALSTMCALDILKAGGNAIDAAIAANACENVVEPMMNGMGGDLMAMIWNQKTKKVYGYNGSGRSPKGFSYEDMQQELKELGQEYIPGAGPLGVSVPGAVKGWCDLHDRFGSMAWEKLFDSAIGYAKDGHPVAQVIAAEWYIPANDSLLTTNGKYPHAIDGFMETFTVPGDTSKGEPLRRTPRYGEVWKNPALANTLTKVQQGGCQEFYNGSIAAAYEAYSKVSGLNIKKTDMAEHHGQWIEPGTIPNTTYRGSYRLFELPPNPQGLAALQQLNILEGYNLTDMGYNTAEYLHVHVEAKKLAFADRAKYYADPDFATSVPGDIAWLTSKEYAAQRRKLIDMNRAAQTVEPGEPPPSSGTHGVPSYPIPATAQEQDTPHAGDTMYLTVADNEGNMISLIQSNYEGFGSGLVIPELGFGLQDRGSLFTMKKGHNNVYAPGKRPFHTIIPAFVTKDDRPWLSFGVMGGNMQPQGHAQILCNIVDFGMNVQEAGDAARYYHTGSSQPTGQVMSDGGRVELEQGVCSTAQTALAAKGHDIYYGPNGGGYEAILRDCFKIKEEDPDCEHFVYHGATELRKDGIAAGW